jgi:hypothetical protein
VEFCYLIFNTADYHAGRLVAENGKMKLLSEALNVANAAQAVFKNGVDDIPMP